jgi:hypothetical protein
VCDLERAAAFDGFRAFFFADSDRNLLFLLFNPTEAFSVLCFVNCEKLSESGLDM